MELIVFSRAENRRRVAALVAVAGLLTVMGAGSTAAQAQVPSSFWTKCQTGSGAGQCQHPRGVVSDPETGHVYVADSANDRIDEFTAWGVFLRSWGWDVVASGPDDDTTVPEDQFEECVPAKGDECKAGVKGAGPGQLVRPQGLALDSNGDLYVAEGDFGNRRVQKFDPSAGLSGEEVQFVLMFGGGVVSGGATGTGELSSGSTTINSVVTTSKAFEVGQTISGAGIPSGTSIVALGPGTLTLSAPVEAGGSGSGVALSAPEGVGNVPTNEKEIVTIGGAPTGGTFSLTFTTPNPSPSSATATAIPFNATAAEVQGKLEALSNIGAGNIAVSGSAGGPYTVEFTGTRFADTDVTQLSASAAELIPSPPGSSVTVVTTVQGAGAGEICTGSADCRAATEGTGPGQFGTWVAGSYIGVNPSTNTVLVGDRERIQEFSSAGSYIKSLPLASGVVQSLAIDQAGNIYVTFRSKPNVYKLSPSGMVLCIIEVEQPNAVATSSVGTIFVVDEHTGIGDGPTEVRLFDPTCIDKHESFGGGEIEIAYGLATSSACDMSPPGVYVSNEGGSDSFVKAYAFVHPDPSICPPPKVPPDIDAQYAATVSSDSAVLRAQINPHFWEDTTYYLEYGTASCAVSTCTTQPLPPGTTLKGAGVDGDLTSGGVVLSGLQPNTTYHYRFVSQSSGSEHELVRGVGGKPGIDGGEATFKTFPLPSPPKANCPNQAFRGGASAHLADCRAYEMVSPVDKNGGDIKAFTRAHAPRYSTGLDQSSTDGEKLAYSSATAFGDALSAPWTSQYIASRKAGQEWSTHAISPPRESKSISNDGNVKFEGEYKAFSADLCSAWLQHDTGPSLAPDAVSGFLNLYRRSDCGAEGYEALTTVEPPTAPASSYRTELQGFAADGSESFFIAPDKLTEDAVSGVEQLYVASGGQLRYVCVLPDGSPSGKFCSAGTVRGVLSDGRENTVARAVSEDGARVYWSSSSKAGEAGSLYLRENPAQEQSALENGDECTEPQKACTVAVSAGPAARFWTASTDGATAIFSEGGTLYEFDAEEDLATPIAEGLVGVAGASEDASRVYFVSTKALDEGAEEGEPNLYLHDAGEGTTTFIATLSSDDAIASPFIRPASPNPMQRASRVSPDGSELAFTSDAGKLTGYDNTDVSSTGSCGEKGAHCDSEVYLYTAKTDNLACISCNPSGARPKGRNIEIDGESQGDFWAAAQVPIWEDQLYAPRALSDDGSRLFFVSFEALIPRDTNGVQDVYEWEQAGSEEECRQAGADLYVQSAGGCLSLISSGESPTGSEFADASPNGRDVFFRTASSLLPQDPGLIDIYDAREEGGLPLPPSPAPPCEGEACQSPPAPPNDPTPSSSTFQGAGNLVEAKKTKRSCPKGKHSVRRNGKARCVAKSKRHVKRGHQSHGRTAR
jgi:NHL repeat